MDWHPSRRGFLGASAAFSAWAGIPRIAAASGRDPRLVLMLLRGGLDGLSLCAPVGDPAYDSYRDEFAVALDGPVPGTSLDNFFALNGRLKTVADLYANREATFIQAVATPYRSRSHFEAQDVLENGTDSHSHHQDGWLGRAVALMEADSRVASSRAFAAASSTPLALRGAPDVITYLPAGFPAASDDTRARLIDLYEHTDPLLAQVMLEGLALEATAGTEAQQTMMAESDMGGMSRTQQREKFRQTIAAAAAAGRSMAADDGPRIGFLDMSGFDTHRRHQQLGDVLEGLDGAIAALRDQMAPVWRDTVVVVVTEFGRTVRMNASDGTDHGTATAAMLLGGAVDGGRVIADWPGLAENALYEGRDLMPTTDLRAVLKGMLRDHLGLEGLLLAERVFPGTEDVRPLDGLVL